NNRVLDDHLDSPGDNPGDLASALESALLILAHCVTEVSDTYADSAMLDQLHHAVSSHGALLGSRDQSLHQIEGTFQEIVQAFRSSGITQSAGPPTSPAPIKYDGVSDNYQGFLMQMKPRLWKSRVPSTYEAFKKCFEAVFDHPLPAHATSDHLMTIRQGGCSVAEYSLEFQTLAEQSGGTPPPSPDQGGARLLRRGMVFRPLRGDGDNHRQSCLRANARPMADSAGSRPRRADS
uniref:Retrotransposon gag domain-containing protein n=1 Tax=Scleropages formosus TaxID=113540 RepID=A0A8C9RXJ9_SCLFO